jgi:hypothetical protein
MDGWMDGFFSVDEMKLFALWMIFRLLQILEATSFPSCGQK